MSLGMTYDEYWKGPPRLARAYREADAIKQENESASQWLQGLYIHEAMATVIHNAFRDKGTQPLHYPEKPYRVTPLSEEEQKAEEEKEIQKIIDNLNAMQRSLNG